MEPVSCKKNPLQHNEPNERESVRAAAAEGYGDKLETSADTTMRVGTYKCESKEKRNIVPSVGRFSVCH